jgi:hypothetical protein
VARCCAPGDEFTIDIELFQHTKRPEWGLAICVEQCGDRSFFLFDTGEVRAIMNEFADLMSKVEPEEEAAAKARKYFAKHAAAAETPKKKAPRRKAKG